MDKAVWRETQDPCKHERHASGAGTTLIRSLPMDVENIRCILSRRCLSAACVVLALWPTSLPAQTVWGIVVDDGTGVPLEGAMMILFDQALQEVDRSLSDAT